MKSKGVKSTLKYIDPTYMIRSTSSNPYDTQLCADLSYQAVHGAMAGFTGFCIGMVNNRMCYIPLELVTQGNKRVNSHGSRY